MLGKKKGFTASQSKRMSRRMQSSTIGTHVAQPSARRQGRHTAGMPTGAQGVDFANGRRSSKATRGFVEQVGMSATSGESDGAYSRRVSRLGYVQEMQRKARMRRAIFLVAAALAVLAVAAGAGVAAYFGSTDSKLSLGSSNAKEALVAAPEGTPFYLLCAAQLESAAAAHGPQTDAYLLVRVDAAAKTLSFASIPANLDVRLSDGKMHPLYEARSVGGDAELIAQVAEFAEVDIAHFASTTAEGLVGMVDAVGGVSLNLGEEVDDPRAGTQVLPAGEQTLDGRSALTLLRARNFLDGFDVTASNRVQFTMQLAQRALSTEGLGFASLVGDAGNYVSTDLSASDLMALGDAVRPLSAMTVYRCVVPGYEAGVSPVLFECYAEEWADMLARFKAGEDPTVLDSEPDGVVASEISVEVRNGAGTTGAATRMGDMLAAAGYQVEGVGNVDDATVYPETLVIYRDDAYEGAAKAVVRAVRGGRVVNGGDFYTFDTDVLVIIGKDWMPAA